MPTAAKRRRLLLDTSAAIAFCAEDHDAHRSTVQALDGQQLGLAGHAAFETFSVLTRLPGPARLTAAAATRLLLENFPHTRFLSPDAAGELLSSLPRHQISGGGVYDALVGACAAAHRLPLATRDRRAVRTYRALDVQVQLLP